MSTAPLTPVQRITRVRSAREATALALGGIRRVLDVPGVDLLEWQRGKPIPRAKGRAGAEVHRFDERSEAAWREIIPRYRQKPLKNFLNRGDVGYVGQVGGEFAGWIWISRVSFRDPWSGLLVRLAPDE